MQVQAGPISANRFRAVGFLVCFAISFVVALTLGRYFGPTIGHDQISYLVEAQRWLAGAQAYGPQLSETNPPLIIWFSALPVTLAHWIPMSEIACLKWIVTVLIAGSVAWSVRILRRGPVQKSRLETVVLGAAVLAAEFALLPADFGQREHLLIVFLAPYLLAVCTGVAEGMSIGENVALGFAAAVGIWLKPYDVLVPVVLQMILCLRRRSLSPLLATYFVSLVASCCVILGAVLAFTPLYFKNTLPLLVDTYWALGTDGTLAIARHLYLYTLLIVVFFLIWFGSRRRLADPWTTLMLLISSVVASIACDLQHTTWKYHRYPHEAVLLLAIVYLAVDLRRSQLEQVDTRYGERAAVAVCAGVAAAICLGAMHHRMLIGGSSSQSATDVFWSQLRPGTTVYVFSTAVPEMGDVYLHHLTWGSRFAHLWMLPAIVKNEKGPASRHAPFKRLAPERLASLSALQRTQTAEDLNRWQPAVVLVQSCGPESPCFALGDLRFDMLAWFLQGQDFASAWSHYRKQPVQVGSYDVYRRVS